MASVINRTTLALWKSAPDGPEVPDAEWLHFATLAEYEAAAAIEQKYRKIVAEVVVEMTQAEKDAVDAQLLADAAAALLAETIADYIGAVAHGRLARAVALIVMDEFNRRADHENDTRNAIINASNLADAKSAMAALTPVPQRTASEFKTEVEAKLGTLS